METETQNSGGSGLNENAPGGVETIGISTTVNGVKGTASLPFTFGANLTEAVQVHNDQAVFNAYHSGARNSFANAMRNSAAKHLKKGASADEIQNLVSADMSDWQLGVSTRSGKSLEDRLIEHIVTLPEDQREDYIRRVMERAAAA